MVQVNNSKIILRIKFKKVGSLQYISHLDLVRTMNKIVVRAALPLYYTEGFNPKPKMVFAAPLSIGTESYSEYMDLRLSERIDPEQAKAALNANMTKEMQVLEAYYPDTDFTSLKWMKYLITVKTSGACREIAEKCMQILDSERIEVMKKTKSGEKMVDIRPQIKEPSVELDGDLIRINAILCADQSAFLNPEYVISALRNGAGILSSPCLTDEYYDVLRLCAYTADMSEFK